MTKDQYKALTTREKTKVWTEYMAKIGDKTAFFGHAMPTREYRNDFMPLDIEVR